MSNSGCETKLRNTVELMAEWLAMALVTAMAVVSTLRLLGIVS
jgi:hypothetical protein